MLRSVGRAGNGGHSAGIDCGGTLLSRSTLMWLGYSIGTKGMAVTAVKDAVGSRGCTGEH
jgi:hypothetical protein